MHMRRFASILLFSAAAAFAAQAPDDAAASAPAVDTLPKYIGMDTALARRVAAYYSPDEASAPRAPSPRLASAPGASAAPVLFGISGLMAVGGILLMATADHEVTRTRTVNTNPCYVLWGDCGDNPEVKTETYTEHETDYGQVLVGMATMAGSAAFLAGGFITVAVTRSNDHRGSQASALKGRDMSFTYSRNF